MPLIETIKGAVTSKRDKGEKLLRSLAEKDAAGSTAKGDADALEQALADTGKSLDDFDQLVGLFKKRSQLSAKVSQDRLDGAGAKVAEARRAAGAYNAETLELREKRRAEQSRLDALAGAAAGELSHLQRRQAELNRFEWDHAELFGVELPDLDRFTLCCNNTVTNANDPVAPPLEVDVATFDEEQSRRFAMMEKARFQRLEAHADAVRKWDDRRATFYAKYDPDVPFKEPPPLKPSSPMWADVVAAKPKNGGAK